VRTRIEPDLKKSAETVLAENGLTISDAIRMFLRQVVVYGGLPFDVRISNEIQRNHFASTSRITGDEGKSALRLSSGFIQ
jgi:DNA-damage-inducible protein J